MEGAEKGMKKRKVESQRGRAMAVETEKERLGERVNERESAKASQRDIKEERALPYSSDP